MSVSVRGGVAERLATLIRIPTVSAELAERGNAPFDDFLEQLRQAYPLLHARLERVQPSPDGVMFRWAGSDPSLAQAPVVLMAHYDVVPVDASDPWTYPPFAGEIADGRVWGRGTLDDKGALVVICEAVENLLAAGYVPARDLWLAFGGNEEVCGDAGLAHADYVRDQGLIPWLVLDEGGAVVDAPLPFVKTEAAMVGVGEKGLMTVRLSARTEGGHASAPSRVGATERIARAICRLRATAFPARVPAAVSALLAGFATQASGAPRYLLKALAAAPGVTAQIFARLGGEPAALVHTTVAVTMLDGGTANNVLASQASATLNLRVALGETVTGTLRRLQRLVRDPKVTLELIDGADPSPASPTDGPEFAAIRAAVQASYPQVVTTPYIMMAASDARHFHRFAPAVYRFAPLAMTKAQRETVHGIDESVTIASLEHGEVFHRHLIQATCGGGLESTPPDSASAESPDTPAVAAPAAATDHWAADQPAAALPATPTDVTPLGPFEPETAA